MDEIKVVRRPEHLTLGEVIAALEQVHPARVLPLGFGNPHSYRGYYDELAFEPCDDVTVAEVLADARSAVGATFDAWKGGEYTMSGGTPCWLAMEGCEGETLGRTLLDLMLAAVVDA